MISDSTDFFDTEAARWSDRYASDPRFARRFEKICQIFNRALPPQPGHALDAGCGTGIFSRELARRGWRVTAIDASPEMIAEAQAAAPDGAVSFFNETYENYAADPQSFDLILSLSALEYVEDDATALKKFSEMLKPGGVLVISVPNRKGLLRLAEGMVGGIRQVTRGKVFRERGEYLAHQKHQYSPLELNLMTREVGLKKVRSTYLNAGFTSPLWLLPLFERRWWAAMFCGVYKKVQ